MNKKFFIALSITSAIFFNGSLQADMLNNQQPATTNLHHQALSNEERALLYLSCGYSNLVSKDYQSALEDYQKASDTLKYSDNAGMDFLISFGMAVACDNLSLTQEAGQHILRIQNLMDASEQRENSMNESMPQDENEVIDYLYRLACISHSIEVQEMLNFFISEVFFSPLISHSKTPMYNVMPSVLSYKTTLIVTPCKSFWKRFRKIRDEIIDTWNSFFKIYKEFKELRDDLTQWQTNEEPI